MTVVKIDKVGKKFVAFYRGVRTKTANLAYLRFKINRQADAVGETVEFTQKGTSSEGMNVQTVVDRPQFDINERFQFCESIVEMIAREESVSATFCGEGGLGKTHTVLNVLKREGLKDLTTGQEAGDDGHYSAKKCFVFVKGFSTAKGLYRTLYNNRNSVVVFDDCDKIQKDPTALDILKSALDSYSNRVVCWNAEARSQEEEDSLPRAFSFEGRIVFISNMTSDEIDQALRSRSMTVDLSMTLDEKLIRMEHITHSADFLPDFKQTVKDESLALIKELKDKAREINLRTLIQVCKIRNTAKPNWKKLATYLLTN